MINLLPPNQRKELAAARTNTLLLRYVILLGILIGIIIVEIGIVYVILNNDKNNNQATINDNNAKTANYAPIKKQADEFRTNLLIAKYILGKQIPYTTLMLAIANGLPEGAVIDQLALDPNSFGKPTTLTVKTTSYEMAIQIKTALQQIMVNKTPLFSDVSFESVSSSESATDQYAFSAVYNVTYSTKALHQ